MSLAHIVGIITGGVSGLGAATASTLIREGARIVVADLPHQYERYLELAEDLCRTAESHPSMRRDRVISFVETDVTNESQVKNALDIVEELYGEPGRHTNRRSLDSTVLVESGQTLTYHTH
jgi:3-hydroxyacyl-CoA dehydrogenase / 3-hydroxy-2-methylbutyryl-CoA dehydrogenase